MLGSTIPEETHHTEEHCALKFRPYFVKNCRRRCILKKLRQNDRQNHITTRRLTIMVTKLSAREPIIALFGPVESMLGLQLHRL